ncbi:MAG: hypothetical protein O3A65_02170 [Proteobacteria bacterium]|nr:hypothetical protein [Pseudomonadota bacterium]
MLRIKLGRYHTWFLYTVGGILTLSGALWLYLHYFIRIEGEFGPIHHPMEHDLLSIHGIVAALMMIGFGSVLPGHVSRAWSMRRNLWTGIFMFTTMTVLSVSGYFLYYLGNESSREVTAIIHWVIGLTLPILAVVHIQRGLKSRRK